MNKASPAVKRYIRRLTVFMTIHVAATRGEGTEE